MHTVTRLSIQSPPMDDSQLAAQAQTDTAAFAELYRRYVTRVYRYHMAHSENVKDAEDLTSQTFVAALESIRSFRGSGSFAAWIMGIACHKRLLFYRARKHLEVPLDSAIDVRDAFASTDKTAMRQLQARQLREALRCLSADRLEAVLLCFFAGLDYSEAARVLRKSEAAVRMLISRALQDLRTRTSLSLEAQDD
jgi:RNA polymerase sigma-70 factor (ECF subfamily)